MGTIANKINKVKNTKDKIKTITNLSTLNAITSETIFKDYPKQILKEYVKIINNGTDELYTNFPKIENEGTKLELDTEKGPLKITLEGNTSQDGTPTPDTPVPIKVVTGNQNIEIRGKNLFDYTKHTALTLDANGRITTTKYYTQDSAVIYKLKPNTNYTFVFRNSNMGLSNYGLAMSVNGNWVQTSTGKYTLTSDSNGEFTIKLGAAGYSSIGVASAYIQLVEGSYSVSTVPNYEPYQVEQTYPINLGSLECCKIGNYSDEFALSTGKNLFDKDNANILNSAIETSGLISASTSGKTLYIPIEGGNTYTIIKTKGQRFRAGTTVNIPSNGDTVDGYITSTTNKLTITTSNESNYLVVYFYLNGTDTLSEQRIIDSIMISLGDNDYPYEPYGNGNWFIRKNIEKIVFNGQETWSSRTNSAGTKQFYTNTFRSDIINNNIQQKCTHGRFSSSTYNSGVVGNFHIIASSSSRPFYICVPSDLDIDTFKTNIGLNNINCYYVMEMAIGIPITDTTLIQQLENINNNAKSYSGTTIIECSSSTDDNETIQVSTTALKKID